MHREGVQSLLLLQLHRPDVALPVADGEVELIAEDVERRAIHLAKRIDEVANSVSLRESMSRSARAKAGRFTWDASVDAHIQLFNDLLARRSR